MSGSRKFENGILLGVASIAVGIFAIFSFRDSERNFLESTANAIDSGANATTTQQPETVLSDPEIYQSDSEAPKADTPKTSEPSRKEVAPEPLDADSILSRLGNLFDPVMCDPDTDTYIFYAQTNGRATKIKNLVNQRLEVAAIPLYLDNFKEIPGLFEGPSRTPDYRIRIKKYDGVEPTTADWNTFFDILKALHHQINEINKVPPPPDQEQKR